MKDIVITVIVLFGSLLAFGIVIRIIYGYFGIGRVKIRFTDPASEDRTIHVGNGNSIGNALADGFRKINNSISESTDLEKIQSKLRSMESAFAKYKKRMGRRAISECEGFISSVRDLETKKRSEIEQIEQSVMNQAVSSSVRRNIIAKERRLLTPSLRYDILKRDGFRCQICGATQADGVMLHVDHIIPVSRGGKTEPSNLRTLCDRCNLGKRDKLELDEQKVLTPEEFLELLDSDPQWK